MPVHSHGCVADSCLCTYIIYQMIRNKSDISICEYVISLWERIDVGVKLKMEMLICNLISDSIWESRCDRVCEPTDGIESGWPHNSPNIRFFDPLNICRIHIHDIHLHGWRTYINMTYSTCRTVSTSKKCRRRPSSGATRDPVTASVSVTPAQRPNAPFRKKTTKKRGKKVLFVVFILVLIVGGFVVNGEKYSKCPGGSLARSCGNS